MLRMHFGKFAFSLALTLTSLSPLTFLMFVQSQHIDTATFAIRACFKFDIFLTSDL